MGRRTARSRGNRAREERARQRARARERERQDAAPYSMEIQRPTRLSPLAMALPPLPLMLAAESALAERRNTTSRIY